MAISAKSKILASDINTALSSKQDALGYTPVKSVNGVEVNAEGDVTVSYPVTSVNGKTGAVTISVPATPRAYVVTTYVSGATGYRKWSDGFIEQWGNVAYADSTNHVISFPTAFTSANCNVQRVNIANHSDTMTTRFYSVHSVTASNFQAYAHTKCSGFYWYACGF